MRKLIGFDDETFPALVQLGRDRMATIQDLADEAFADLLRKHGVPIDLKDALRRSVRNESGGQINSNTKSRQLKTKTKARRRRP